VGDAAPGADYAVRAGMPPCPARPAGVRAGRQAWLVIAALTVQSRPELWT
jgi:hypothetical protein